MEGCDPPSLRDIESLSHQSPFMDDLQPIVMEPDSAVPSVLSKKFLLLCRGACVSVTKAGSLYNTCS